MWWTLLKNITETWELRKLTEISQTLTNLLHFYRWTLLRSSGAWFLGFDEPKKYQNYFTFLSNISLYLFRPVLLSSTSISTTQHNYNNDLHVTCRYPAFELELHHEELLYRRPLCAVLAEDWAVICESLIEPSSIPREARQPEMWKTFQNKLINYGRKKNTHTHTHTKTQQQQ